MVTDNKGTDLASTPISKTNRALIIKKDLYNLHVNKGTKILL